MANRIEIEGGEYETEEGEEKNSYWIEVSSSLMNEVTSAAIEDGADARDFLGAVVSGEVSLENGQPLDEAESDE